MGQPSATRVAHRWLVAARIDDAIEALAATSQSRYPEDAPEEIRDALGDSIMEHAGPLVDKLIEFMKAGRGKAAVSGEDEIEDGREEEEHYHTITTWWTITYPTSVMFEHGIYTTVAAIAKTFIAHSLVRDHKLDRKAVAAFFKDRTVLQYIEAQWLDGVKGGIEDVGEYALHERAEELAYDNSDYNVRVTEYDMEGEEEVHPEGPEIRFTFHLGWKGASFVKGGLSGDKLSFRMSAKYGVRLFDSAYPGDYNYDRLYGY